MNVLLTQSRNILVAVFLSMIVYVHLKMKMHLPMSGHLRYNCGGSSVHYTIILHVEILSLYKLVYLA